MKGTIMIKSKGALLESIKAKLGEDTSDDTISLMEDISDTFDDYESKVSDSTNWKQKYEENDANWRQKYTDRFFNAGDEPEVKPKDVETTEVKTFDDLFKVEEK